MPSDPHLEGQTHILALYILYFYRTSSIHRHKDLTRQTRIIPGKLLKHAQLCCELDDMGTP